MIRAIASNGAKAMNILKSPEEYAKELVDTFGNEEIALKEFNEARNFDDGFICKMPQNWCIAVATALNAYGAKAND